MKPNSEQSASSERTMPAVFSGAVSSSSSWPVLSAVSRYLSCLLVTSGTLLWTAWQGIKTGLQNRIPRGDGREEGSIGEWVMILVMAVGITLFIWAIAQPMLGSILRRALSKLLR